MAIPGTTITEIKKRSVRFSFSINRSSPIHMMDTEVKTSGISQLVINAPFIKKEINAIKPMNQSR
jgi:hypothetical protein